MTGALLAMIVIAALAAAVPVTAQSVALKSVRDQQNRFSIAVPSTWHVTTQSKNPAIEAKSPATSAMLPDSLDVTVYDWSANINPQQCISESDMVLRYTIHTWTTVRQGPTTVGGQPAYMRVYDWKTASAEPRQSVEVCMTHANRVYVAVGTTENTSAKVSATMPLLERAIATLTPNLANAPAPSETHPTKVGQ
ncbi:MAG TPA: hypothetical protein VKW09_15320 [bacterium]|nr:hypothetical protein [bacterium]